MAIRIEPLEDPIGALVHGLDSRRPLGAGDFAAVDDYTEPRRMLRMIVGNSG